MSRSRNVPVYNFAQFDRLKLGLSIAYVIYHFKRTKWGERRWVSVIATKWPFAGLSDCNYTHSWIEGKADRTAKGYKFICPIFRLDKTSLHQGLEKLSDKIRLSLAAVCSIGPCKNRWLHIQTDRILERPHNISFETSVLSHTLVIKRDNNGHDIGGSF